MKLDRTKLSWMMVAGLAIVGLTLWGDAPGATGVAGGPAAVTGNVPYAPYAATGNTPSAAQVEPAPDLVMAAGTPLRIRLDTVVSTTVSRPGDHFTGTLVSAAVVNGVTVLPRGTSVGGVVVDSAPSGRLKGHAVLTLRLNSVSHDGRTLWVSTGSDTRTSAGHKETQSGLDRRRNRRRFVDWSSGGWTGGRGDRCRFGCGRRTRRSSDYWTQTGETAGRNRTHFPPV